MLTPAVLDFINIFDAAGSFIFAMVTTIANDVTAASLKRSGRRRCIVSPLLRLVDEKYILVNERHSTIGYLIENINRGLLHRALSALTFRSCGGVCHRAALCFGEDYLPGHVDKHLRSAPTGWFRGRKIEDQLGVRT
ncbi:hypothetical protein BD769DRAFT_1383806 [Suillus cothurnatus]|nr:hypothetical protein BD769DRAFT_1383806 [Suillus cothurnatus]